MGIDVHDYSVKVSSLIVESKVRCPLPVQDIISSVCFQLESVIWSGSTDLLVYSPDIEGKFSVASAWHFIHAKRPVAP